VPPDEASSRTSPLPHYCPSGQIRALGQRRDGRAQIAFTDMRVAFSNREARVPGQRFDCVSRGAATQELGHEGMAKSMESVGGKIDPAAGPFERLT